MKRITTIAALLFVAMCSKAQLLGSVFNQNATQRQYLQQQIAALKVYTSYLQKGYRITKEGLNTISSIKSGDLNLHTGYFNALKMVNPAIKRYSKVAGIIALQKGILKKQKSSLRRLKSSRAFAPAELNYISNVFSALLADCSRTIDELITLTTDGNLQMKDDERLQRIDALYSDMQHRNTFLQRFTNEAQMLAASRLHEQQEVQNSRIINGIKNKQP